MADLFARISNIGLTQVVGTVVILFIAFLVIKAAMGGGDKNGSSGSGSSSSTPTPPKSNDNTPT